MPCRADKWPIALVLFCFAPALAYGGQQSADTRVAVREIEAALAQDPSQAVLHYEAGMLYRRLGDHRKAADHLELAVNHGFRNLGALYHLISAQFAAGRRTEALERAKELIAARPASPETVFRVGKLLFENLYYRPALEAFRLARETDPDAYEIRFYLALTHYLLNQHRDAAEELAPLAESQASPETRTLLASARALMGDFTAAESILTRLMETAPQSPHAWVNLALIRLEQQRLEEAEALLGKLRAKGQYQDAKVFYIVQRSFCAEAEAASEAQPDPEQAGFLLELAEAFQRRYHHATAVALLRLARRRQGDSARILHALGVSCFNLDPASPTAQRLLAAAIARDPALGHAHYMLGRAWLRQGRVEEAIEALRKAVALEPSSGDYWTELGKALARHQPEQEAIAALRQAITLAPPAAVARYELGSLLLRKGAVADAVRELEQAVDAEPEFYEAYYLLGQAQARLGNREKAKHLLATFEKKKQAALEQSVVSAGFASGGR
jgi:tetratricopeptide (TPR) repeat protein